MLKPLWPILAAIILVAIVFNGPRNTVRAMPPARDKRAAARLPRIGIRRDVETMPSETGASLNCMIVPRCLPPADFQSQRATQVLAFLIRNRGKLDNNVVRKKWEYLDEFSLPLAIYLRDIEARDYWSNLGEEIRLLPMPLGRKSSSVMERKLTELMPVWKGRGEELLGSLSEENPASANEQEILRGDDTELRPISPY